MRIYVMTDMEGVAGVLDHDNWCQPAEGGYPGRYYDLGREYLTREVNAAIEGLFLGGAEEIVVADGHGAGGIIPSLLDARARLMRGWPEGYPLLLDATYDAVAWVGQHAKAGTPRAHLAHTQWFNYLDQSINGLSIGEFGEFALCAGELGVPAILACGDEAFCHEASAAIPRIVAVAVKAGLTPDDGSGLDTQAYMHDNLSAIHLHPEVAREAIREGACTAILRLKSEPKEGFMLGLPPPYERVTVFRPDERHAQRRIDRATHPSSIAGALNMPYDPRILEK